MKSVAILKCLGASSRQVLATYVLQVLWLAACGSVLGVGVAGGRASRRFRAGCSTPLGVTHVGVITASAAVQGVAVGLLVSLLFALVPLLEMRRVKPLLLLRADTATTARRRDWQSWLAGVGRSASRSRSSRSGRPSSLRAGLFVSGGLARRRRSRCSAPSRAARSRGRGRSRGRRGSRCVTP